ncbi:MULTISPECIES: amino acid ABC transporter permease [Microbacterium]|uniref:L-cystine transport system permease protein TcyB n=1 Tax=Microbacterium ginsengisoli TaxID=400772 RepID=A0A0F0M386_9MICO|nr:MULTISPECIES: amino acid ABC transporter permease [Microbacterium]KJL42122.1 L-cystine transport system permease protein TcyB [Microbacterium ginsengisoli]KJL42137.1 L-cystine transport system permease protein TcyB [Microbacterium ginsengisoli]MCK9917289.1 amino acid ABC transporter permease [Microbacteriaceae bacterium K1510]
MNLADYLPQLGQGLLVSLQLTVISVVAGYAIGLAFALGVASRNPWLRWPALVLVEVGRSIPALVVLYIVYYGLPSVGILLDSFPAAAAGLTFTAAAYSSEMFRAGIRSVPKGQTEAALALGLSRRSVFGRVVLPQGLRSAIPPLMGLAIQSFQGTSLAYSISVNELMSQAYQISAVTFQYLQVYAITGLIYVIIAVPSTWASVYVEHRLARGQA